ncbi:MAG TPA: hypothetical protein VNI84_14660 [Pyrinomonadaceae bacterium]|nr:hypothetical protein [Pyrinomonadaceae bacterium]
MLPPVLIDGCFKRQLIKPSTSFASIRSTFVLPKYLRRAMAEKRCLLQAVAPL